MVKLLLNQMHYDQVLKRILHTSKSLLIVTADIKDLFIEQKNEWVPLLKIFSFLYDRGIDLKIMYSTLPGKKFQKELKKYPNLNDPNVWWICWRSHWKFIIIDEVFFYIGSANMTGAGIGARSGQKRNFEAGIISEDQNIARTLKIFFEKVLNREYCKDCKIGKSVIKSENRYCSYFKLNH